MATTIKVKFRPSTVTDRPSTIVYLVTHNRVVRQITTDYRIYPASGMGNAVILPDFRTYPLTGRVQSSQSETKLRGRKNGWIKSSGVWRAKEKPFPQMKSYRNITPCHPTRRLFLNTSELK